MQRGIESANKIFSSRTGTQQEIMKGPSESTSEVENSLNKLQLLFSVTGGALIFESGGGVGGGKRQQIPFGTDEESSLRKINRWEKFIHMVAWRKATHLYNVVFEFNTVLEVDRLHLKFQELRLRNV
ncbi:hypothetical protein CDAR_184091 [Caerostris darwini]|uniref:Uncharacterized protein n=1 Tax=Caerostris darwini TaxID=1538125 RepID=A0AAV4QS62_9ARAC|nr:hypothetical protein CDAR_184091 [Caerostris darwini]